MPSAMEAPRRHLTERQVELVQRLVEAAAEEVAEHGYGPITVRSIAKRAGVATATAYTYFSSKDHLLAEVLWRRIQALPPPLVDTRLPVAQRVADAVQEMSLDTVDRPELVAACTAALLAPGPDVQRVRSQIGAEIHRRLQRLSAAAPTRPSCGCSRPPSSGPCSPPGSATSSSPSCRSDWPRQPPC